MCPHLLRAGSEASDFATSYVTLSPSMALLWRDRGSDHDAALAATEDDPSDERGERTEVLISSSEASHGMPSGLQSMN